MNAHIAADLSSEIEAQTALSFKQAAENYWNNQQGMGPNGEVITFAVNLQVIDKKMAGAQGSLMVDTLSVVDGPGRSYVDMTLRYGGAESAPDSGQIFTVDTTGNPAGLAGIAPHETGHLMGFRDTYPRGAPTKISFSPHTSIMHSAQPENSLPNLEFLFSLGNGNVMIQQ